MSDRAEDSTRVPQSGVIKPWQFWLIFFGTFFAIAAVGSYGLSNDSNVVVATALVGGVAILMTYLHFAQKLVIQQ